MTSPVTPLMYAAVLSVLAYGSIGIAGITGMFSLADSAANPFANQRFEPLLVRSPNAMVRPISTRAAPVQSRGTRPIDFQHGRPVTAEAKKCDSCGVIEKIVRREARVHIPDDAPESNLGNPLVGLAYAAPEQTPFPTNTVGYIVTVRMDDGSFRTRIEQTRPNLRHGQRVVLENGAMAAVR